MRFHGSCQPLAARSTSPAIEIPIQPAASKTRSGTLRLAASSLPVAHLQLWPEAEIKGGPRGPAPASPQPTACSGSEIGRVKDVSVPSADKYYYADAATYSLFLHSAFFFSSCWAVEQEEENGGAIRVTADTRSVKRSQGLLREVKLIAQDSEYCKFVTRVFKNLQKQRRCCKFTAKNCKKITLPANKGEKKL